MSGPAAEDRSDPAGPFAGAGRIGATGPVDEARSGGPSRSDGDLVASGPAVEGRGLRKRYGELIAVDGVDFAVARQECYGFLGPNGAGKTTTMKMIYGLAAVDEGELRVLGRDARTMRREVKARIGVVPQEASLDGDLDVRGNLAVQALYHGISADGRIDELLRLALLDERAGAAPRELSGGMKRRLLIVRALVNRPDLVVLDEPTTGLDPQARLAVWGMLDRLKAEGVTLIVTTHYMEEAERICDRLAIMDEGRIVAEGSPAELRERHSEPNLEGVFLKLTGRTLRE